MKSERMSIYIPSDVLDRVKAAAHNEKRSVSQMVTIILDENIGPSDSGGKSTLGEFNGSLEVRRGVKAL